VENLDSIEEMNEILRSSMGRISDAVKAKRKQEQRDKKIADQITLAQAGFALIRNKKRGDELTVLFKREHRSARLVRFSASGVMVEIGDDVKNLEVPSDHN
jgi:hypothetical protein